MHHKIYLSEFPESYILAAEAETVETAIVFVHGFLGDAFDTWVDFQSSIDREAGWESADLYFLQYDSFTNSVGASVERFRRFLERVELAPEDWFEVTAKDLPPVIRKTLRGFRLRSGPTSYRRLLLVGHSLGAVVVRKAIVDRASEYCKRLEKAAAGKQVPAPALLQAPVRLFAPAISGARPAGFFGVALRLRGLGGLAGLVLGFSPSYKELLPTETNVVSKLEETTTQLAERFKNLPAFRADILWAERDDIVVDQKYFWDNDCGRAVGTDHVSVCKPGRGYRQPLDLVARGEV